jgi:hypothetical protein
MPGRALSDAIKTKKDLINNSQSHANVVASHSIFSVDGDQANVPFFDNEDAYHVQTDLWLAAAVALDLMKLLREVNTGREVIELSTTSTTILWFWKREWSPYQKR